MNCYGVLLKQWLDHDEDKFDASERNREKSTAELILVIMENFSIAWCSRLCSKKKYLDLWTVAWLIQTLDFQESNKQFMNGKFLTQLLLLINTTLQLESWNVKYVK